MLLCSMKNGKSFKLISCVFSTVESDRLYLNYLKKPKIMGVAHFPSTICGTTKMVMKQKKFRVSYSCPPNEGHVHMSIRSKKCGPIDFKCLEREYIVV